MKEILKFVRAYFYKKWLNTYCLRQNYLLKHLFIMNNGVATMKKSVRVCLMKKGWGFKIMPGCKSLLDGRMIELKSPIFPLNIDLKSPIGSYLGKLVNVRITIEEIK